MGEKEALFDPFKDASQEFSFYPSLSHRKAFMRISRGLESHCGLVLLTGEIGIGKTTLCRYLQRHHRDGFVFAGQDNPFLSPEEQLRHFCEQYRINTSGRAGSKELMDALTDSLPRLHDENKVPVIIIDECHLLAREHFGQLLVLSNLRRDFAPLVNIVLVGQVEMLERLREPGFEALNQRIGVRCELEPLSPQETKEYIHFKLRAGEMQEGLFDEGAIQRVWRVSGGLPRLINHCCSHLLDQLEFLPHKQVTVQMVDRIVNDAMYEDLFTIRTKKRSWLIPSAAAAAIAAGIVLVGWGWMPHSFWDGGGKEPIAPIVKEEAAGPVREQAKQTEQAVLPSPVEEGKEAASLSAPPPGKLSEMARNPMWTMEYPGEGALMLSGFGARGDWTVLTETGERLRSLSGIDERSRRATLTGAGERLRSLSGAGGREAAGPIRLAAHTPYAPGERAALSKATEVGAYPDTPAEPAKIAIPTVGKIANEKDKPGEKKPVDVAEKKFSPGSVTEAKDGDAHPVVGTVVVDAVAWSSVPEERIAVLNQRIFHEGDSLGRLRLEQIGEKALFFQYQGDTYKVRWGAQW